MEIRDDELEQAVGGAYRSTARTATNETSLRQKQVYELAAGKAHAPWPWDERR